MKQSSLLQGLDCFASLAMTRVYAVWPWNWPCLRKRHR